ncbi:LTA synthase family protein [Roseburia sp. MSJ-14]|uniref:LTA synthase family protein n=1 Tax=Roseburia sp. MSJ-14 TaxID=2841514 RepID=UPI001C124B04|nr:sulfatase-like hydrolase/transferase [Roseburia sp. MSJ-14]MBU5472405.1 sulfatase-like hydrolase/transferase [Roseburia sp. MSJ-14]
MYNSIKETLHKFYTNYKSWKEKRATREKKHLLKPEQRERLLYILNRYSLVFHYLLACLVCFFIEVISRHSFLDAFSFMFDRSLVFLYNSLIVFTSLHLVYFFRRRALMRTLISVIWLFLGTINGCVLLKRVTPFSYTDLKLVNDLFTMQSNYFSQGEAIAVIVLVAAVIAFIGILWKKGPKYTGKQHRVASILAVGAFALFIPMVTQAAVSNNILASYFENIAQGYKDYGFVYSFSASVVDRGMKAPDNYSDKTVQAALDKVTVPTTDASVEKPNIICVLLESFVDPNEVNFLECSKNPVPNFENLAANYSSGYLTVPVVGAGTANTEFEVLTGMGMRYFGLGEYPYKTILKTNSCESIADDLKNLGYGTAVVHNNGGNFYSRANAFSQMGFDNFTSKEMMDITEYTPLGTWPTDDILVNEVAKALDATPQQDFIYTITVQGHGAYPTDKVIENPEISVTGADSEEANNEWEYYVNEIHEVDKFIANLTTMLSQRDEKTVVVFFGDHLPTMGLEDSDMKSGSIFKTRYVTWNNFGMEKIDRDITSSQLLAAVTDQLGIHEGTMFRLHQNNNFQDIDNYTDDMELLQYDILYGNRYAYGQKDLYPASNLVMGVQDVVIDNLSVDGNILYLTGQNFTRWSKVFVNGEKVSTTYIDGTHLKISLNSLDEGTNSIMVNQMGSSETVFRSSNEVSFDKPEVIEDTTTGTTTEDSEILNDAEAADETSEENISGEVEDTPLN